MEEVWRDVFGYEGLYQVSNLGRVKSLDRCIITLKNRCRHYKERILKQFGGDRHYSVTIEQKGVNVHILVARAFPEICGEWFDGCVVHHKDFNKHNNIPENLIILTASEHSKIHYKSAPDTFKKPSEKRSKSISKALKGRRNAYKHIPILQFTLKGEFIKEWECISDVILDGFDPSNVCWCCKGKLKTAYGYIWKYK